MRSLRVPDSSEPLRAGYSPFEVDAEAAVRWEEAPFDEVELVVVLKQQGQARLVSLRSAHSLRAEALRHSECEGRAGKRAFRGHLMVQRA